VLSAFFMSMWVTRVTAQSGSQGSALFEKSCYSCHNIGSGDKKGPDLKGVTTRRSKDWLHEYIGTPAALNRKGDAAATELFKKYSPEVMPDQALSQDQTDSILALIDELTKKNEVFVPAGAKLSRPIGPGDIDAGLQLFTGRRALGGGGTACISCHSTSGVGSLGGGTLGPDLTTANVKYRDPELISILQNPSFPTMKSVFGTRPLTEEEIVQVFAYLQNAKAAGQAASAPPGLILEPWFVAIGFGLACLGISGLNLVWRKRLRGKREELVRRNRS
jgi:mono/diheme cytochrome c family protein